MMDYCPNCGNKKDLEIDKDKKTLYCPECDQTFTITEGKARPEKVGRLQGIEDRLDKVESDGKQVKKDLYGKEDFF